MKEISYNYETPKQNLIYQLFLKPQKVFKILISLIFIFANLLVQGQTPTPLPPIPRPTPPVIIVTANDETNNQTTIPQTQIDNDKTVYWSLHEAIKMALENNVDIAIARKNVRIAEFNIHSAEGVYDTIFTAAPSFSSNKQPNIGRFSGVSATENSTATKSLNLNAGVQKQIKFGGGSFQASFDNPRTTSNSAIVSPLYSPQLSFSYTQPLWRNRQIDSNRLQIYVAKKNLTLTDVQFHQQVISIIFQVQQAYWNLALALRNVTVQKDGVSLAQKQADDNQKQVAVGMLAPLDVVTAKSTLETRRQSLIQAEITAVQAQNTLKTLLVDGTQSGVWEKEIFPTDFYEETPLKLSLNDALTDAYTNRTEAAQFKVQSEINQLNIDYFRDQTKPQIDLVGSYSITGAGGTPSSTLTCPSGTTLNSATSLCLPGNILPTLVTSNVNSKFVGGYGTALGNLLSNQYNTINVGVNIALPFRNKTAKANLGKALETENQTQLQSRKQLQTIEVDVRNAYQTVLLAQSNLESARLARQYAETQLDGEQKKFASGLSTTFLILTRQNDLIQARGAEVRGLADYNNAVSALQQATGMTLTSNNVEIK